MLKVVAASNRCEYERHSKVIFWTNRSSQKKTIKTTGRWVYWVSFPSNRFVWRNTQWKDHWPSFTRPSGPVCPSISYKYGWIRGQTIRAWVAARPVLLRRRFINFCDYKWPKNWTGTFNNNNNNQLKLLAGRPWNDDENSFFFLFSFLCIINSPIGLDGLSPVYGTVG